MYNTGDGVGRGLQAALHMGWDPWLFTVDEWLDHAVQSESIAHTCGPRNWAYSVFCQQMENEFRMAELREAADRFNFTRDNTVAVFEATRANILINYHG